MDGRGDEGKIWNKVKEWEGEVDWQWKWKHTFNIYAILIGKLIAFTNSIDTFIHEICINFDMHEQQLWNWELFTIQFSFWSPVQWPAKLTLASPFPHTIHMCNVHSVHMNVENFPLIRIFISKIICLLIGSSIHFGSVLLHFAWIIYILIYIHYSENRKSIHMDYSSFIQQSRLQQQQQKNNSMNIYCWNGHWDFHIDEVKLNWTNYQQLKHCFV